jgi:putative phosphoesterase
LKLGIVSDVHCNIVGLKRAVEMMGDIDELLCLGDSIYEYRFSNDVIRYLRDSGAHVILGNHEEGFLSHTGVRAREAEWIDKSLLGWMADQPHRRDLTFGNKKMLMVHSTPWEPRGAYVHPTSSQLKRFGEVDADYVLYGHTHYQVAERFGRVLVINPGSAGDARDSRNGRQLSFAVLDTATDEVVITDYADGE